MDSKQVVARFEAERQALALMDHPHIAKVHDAGTTEAGRPYFVMELVRGLPVTRWCDEHDLPMGERLRLFTEVCHAVQAAHDAGVVHRDLKPSNIMIDEQQRPVITDFGLANIQVGETFWMKMRCQTLPNAPNGDGVTVVRRIQGARSYALFSQQLDALYAGWPTGGGSEISVAVPDSEWP